MFSEHSDELWRYAARRVGPTIADDVVCESFLVAWRRMEDIPAGKDRTWLYSTARHVISNEQRASRRFTALAERLAPAVEQISGPDLAEDIVERDVVSRTLKVLSGADQEVLRLSEWEQLTDREAAEVLGCSRAAYRLRLHRARRRFAAALSGRGPLASEHRLTERAPARPAVLEKGATS